MALGRRLVVVIASASMVLVSSFGVASAHDVSADSNVTIETSQKGFKGKVTSSFIPCTVQRKVTVYKVKPGNDKKVDSTTTNLKGKWSLKVGDPKGKYYSKVGRILDEFTDVDEYQHLHECSGDKSDQQKA